MFTFRSKLRCKTSCKLRAHFARTLGQLRTNFGPTSHELRTNFAQTSGQLRRNFGPTSRKLRANFAQTSGQLRTNFGPTSHKLRAIFVRIELRKCRATSYVLIKFMATSHELRKKTWLNFVRSLGQFRIKLKVTSGELRTYANL